MKPDKTITSPDTLRKDRVPPGQHVTQNFPVLHHGDVPAIDLNKWNFRITGLVKKERTLSFSEFTALPITQVLSDIHCVTTWTRLDNLWEGISTGAIKDLVQILPAAKFAIVHAAGGFTTNLPMEDFFAEDVLFAMKYNGKQLEPEHGYPVRLIVPRLYFWKSAKWAEGVEFVAEDRPGFWEQRGYHMHGDPWKEERRT
ncbi:MAG: sulfite oxidase-like oxidoreductase [Planctomycetes bacterium]|nr:sulfite oxidase-like oxidoreductase [Planctomycetota bacterium]